MKKFKSFTLSDSTKKNTSTEQTSVLCTISGGQDSILTFFVLLHLSHFLENGKPKNFLQILYCHHFWQIKNFFSARFVFQLTYLVKVSYTLILPQNSILTENESRDWRKNNFCRVSQLEHVLTSLTGHTETDTLEKNLNNLFRGTSPASFSYFSFLICQNRANLFFSSIILNKCFFRLKKMRKNSQDVFLEKKKDSVYFTTASFNLVDQCSSESNKRKIFNYCKKKKKFFNNFIIVAGQKKLGNSKSGSDLSLTTKILFLSKPDFRVKSKRDFNKIRSKKSVSFCFSKKFNALQVNLEKPLKKTTRFTVSKFVNFYKLPNLIDVTNFSSNFSRNKIRHQLIPFMRFVIHPKMESLLTHFFKMLNEEYVEREKGIDELYFLFQIVNSKSRKQPIFFISHISTLSILGVRGFFIPLTLEMNFKPSLELYQVCMELSLFLSHKLVKEKMGLIKCLVITISGTKIRSLSQKLFCNYKNLTLNYSQNLKLHNFI